ncbi:haloacid dehalogenase type II [Roseococcus sp. SDR]|uniref:haloacid dehalogenase type II n=1 Tax=Roseococcus sp. SDR TaxID=2835532 RepID=UPI001BCBEF82|nr:haloacid dehalogenase type II [Roseococcus sp. SDR]MBS7790922.1 haloacid dehalogenase type II [Roseococcus sp. SDR]MBV1846236.1 haloacid dehalogenase type II [Roseococcus sp. SDR]
MGESWEPPARPEREIEAVIFDAYGTLLDVHSAVARHAPRIGPQAAAFSAEWRVKQLEYSWVRSLTGPAHHQDFWVCTQEALAFVCTRHGVRDQALIQDLLDAYRTLDAYAEVPAMLQALREKGARTAILSNGSPLMLADATKAAGISTLLDMLLSVEAVGIFKPDPRVYALASERLGLPARRMAFVSANPWDTQAAHAAGFRAIRVNRTNAPDEYGLAAAGVPSLTDLSGLPGLIP